MEDKYTSEFKGEYAIDVKPFELKIDIQGYSFYWNIIKLNWLQKLLLRILGIKITKFKEDK